MRLDYKVTGIADINAVLRDVGPREGRNLMRATVFDIAKQLAADASDRAPKDQGELAAGIKAKRERSPRDRVNSSVRAAPFYWRFLEYGDGPDNEQGLADDESRRPKGQPLHRDTSNQVCAAPVGTL